MVSPKLTACLKAAIRTEGSACEGKGEVELTRFVKIAGVSRWVIFPVLQLVDGECLVGVFAEASPRQALEEAESDVWDPDVEATQHQIEGHVQRPQSERCVLQSIKSRRHWTRSLSPFV